MAKLHDNKMKKTCFVLFIISLLSITISCTSGKKVENFTAITDGYFKEKCAFDPLEATVNGQAEYNDQLVFEMTETFKNKKKAFFEKYLDLLQNTDTTQLSTEEKNSYDIIKWEATSGLLLLKQNYNLTPLNQFECTHLKIGRFASGEASQPFKTEKDYYNFLNRMDLFATWMDSAMVYMKKGIQQNVVLPKTLTLKVIPQFEEMTTATVDENLFYSSCKKFPLNFTNDQKNNISKAYSKTIKEKLLPRFQKMTAFLKSDYLQASRNSSGIGSLTRGNELYAAYIEQWTTTNNSSESIHELGLREVARIKTEMEMVKTQVGFKGSIIDFFDYVRNNPMLKPFKKPEEVLANFEKINQVIKPHVDKLFSLQPKSPFVIKRTESFREKSASAEYIQGSADGTLPGTFYVPIPDVENYNYYADEDLFLHEAIPGHHFQLSLQQENESLPNFRKFNWIGAYGEGWALYTESLGKELGLYTDPYQYFGMLSSEMHRAIRLVVDTGIHSKGWTREQAILYSMENEAESEASIISEIERYMAYPGQALSYKLGQLKIIELRQKAQREMKNKFDIKIFHQKILESGVMPLELLEKKINQWIKTIEE